MEIRPIKTDQDYNDSIKRIEELWGAKRDTPQGDEFDLLCTLVESWEIANYPIAHPILLMQFYLEWNRCK